MRKFAFLSFLVSLSLFCNVGNSQNPAALPNDPRVKNGTIANGLSYIIIKNAAQPKQAHFVIAQRVGTSLERDNTFGSFLLLEQLALKGTRNFEGNSMQNYLFKIGVKKEDIEFSTNRDKITYLIKNVPVSRESVIDSSLLILYNWMSSINIDEEDLNRERGILRSRLLNEWDAEKRLEDKEIKTLYPKSPYANVLDPQNISSVGRLNSKDVRSFYYNWCRPDLQCVIVVGDVDPAKIETKIKSIFSTIPKPLKTEKREYYTPDKFQGIKSIVLKDKEYGKTKIEISFLKEPIKAEYKKTNLPYIQDYMDFAVIQLLSNRIKEGIIQKELPIYDIEIEKGKFLNMEKVESYTISFETIPTSVYSSITFINSQIKQIAANGFNEQEFNSSVEIYWRFLENAYDNRANFVNDIYLQRALNNYYEGYSLASTEMNFEIMKQVLFTIDRQNLNAYVSALLKQEDNVVISCKIPDVANVPQISEERLISSFSNSLDDAPSNARMAQTLAWPQVELKTSSSIVNEAEDSLTQERIITLSNGATIILKEIDGDRDTIKFKAISKGGFSLMRGVNIGNQDFFNEVLNVGGLSNLSAVNMKRLYSYNHTQLKSRVNQNTEELYGYTLSSNLDKLLSAITLSFNNRRKDVSAYNILKQRMLYEMQFRNISPYDSFIDTVNYYNNSNKNYVTPLSEEQIENYNYDNLYSTLNMRFSNAADFYFFFTGSNIGQYKEQIINYIGAIPGDKSERENWVVVPNYRSKGVVQKRFLKAMSVPRSFVDITLTLPGELNFNNHVMAKLTQSYINSYLKDNYEKIITNLNVLGEMEYYPESILVVKTKFETDSLNATKIVNSLFSHLKKVAKGEISNSNFSLLSNSLISSYNRVKTKGEFWLNYLAIKYLGGKDLVYQSKEIEKISKANFVAFIDKLLSRGNSISIIMDGTTADVETERLLKENDFVREYFNVE